MTQCFKCIVAVQGGDKPRSYGGGVIICEFFVAAPLP